MQTLELREDYPVNFLRTTFVLDRRASMPVMTVAMAFFIEGQQPTVSTVISLAVLSLGVAVCVWDNQVIPPILACMFLAFCSIRFYQQWRMR